MPGTLFFFLSFIDIQHNTHCTYQFLKTAMSNKQMNLYKRTSIKK